MHHLRVAESPGRGRGVFAETDFAAGELIERCPVLVLPVHNRPLITKTVLDGYFFNWVAGSKVVAVVLGYGSLYNHSRRPNAAYDCRTEHNEMDFVALQPIRRGEEIFVNYGLSPDDQRPMWFERGDEADG